MDDERTEAVLLIGSSETNPDIYYRTRFFVPDPCVYFEHAGERVLLLNDLELDRGRSEARVDLVLPLSELRRRIPSGARARAGLAHLAHVALRERGVTKLIVPGDLAVMYADLFRSLGYALRVKTAFPFFAERVYKSEEEVGHIRRAQFVTERAMALAIEMVSASDPVDGVLHLDGAPLTSERLKGEINAFLAREGYTATHTIVSSGAQSAMPHHSGTGPIAAGVPIVIDIFPRSQETGYWGDMTRTVVRGRPTDEARRMYEAVLEGQHLALSMIRAGVAGKEVHEGVMELFRRRGFETGVRDGRMEGFIHSTGHGLGLEIHEHPRITSDDTVLEEGMVVTVEPGLYYERVGGVRIEDVVVVTADGCVNLNTFPKTFEV